MIEKAVEFCVLVDVGDGDVVYIPKPKFELAN